MFARVSHRRFGDIDVPGNPVNLSETPGCIDSPSPDLGEHTDDVLQNVLNMTKESINAMRERGIVR
jgi:crotonobetainyl-CoA:carnitine CoA-transferase CaiB-like acyl-CoA transferase